jgi:hypothetical protein
MAREGGIAGEAANREYDSGYYRVYTAEKRRRLSVLAKDGNAVVTHDPPGTAGSTLLRSRRAARAQPRTALRTLPRSVTR